jgi:SAM-dependent methyltransferase
MGEEQQTDIVKAKEKVFHDHWAQATRVEDIEVDKLFTAVTAPENRYIISLLGDIKGKRLLDLGCGLGESTAYFASLGADVIATDLSPEMVRLAGRLAEYRGNSVLGAVSSADELPFKDESFDIVYCANLLHHVDVEKTIREVHRLLKTGGIMASWDPLLHNPLIKVYRRLATEVRTEDEHPLRMKDLKIWRSLFSRVEYNGFWLFTLWIFLRFYLIEHVSPNKERYWKKIIKDAGRLTPIYNRCERLDKLILGILPFLKRYCWNLAVVAWK